MTLQTHSSKRTNSGERRQPNAADPFWTVTVGDLLTQLRTDGAGLSTAEASRRFGQFGPNELDRPSRLLDLLAVARRVTNPLVVILLLASIVSGFVGEYVNATIIVLMVIASSAIDVFQTHRSQAAAEQLRKRVESKANVKRDGEWRLVSTRDVVAGDLLRLEIGDIVPADARILETNSLLIDEGTFTGESFPVEKAPSDTVSDSRTSGASNTVFMGTIVLGGTAEAVVVRTGRDTVYAGIAGVLERAAPETAFDRGLREFGLLIAKAVFFLVVFVLVMNLIGQRSLLESLLFSIALAVGLTPEFLPMILSVTQAQGALRMARSRVIVRQLAAIQNLGNMDVICSDKTGTLTEGRMQLVRAVDGRGQESDRLRLLAYLNAHLQSDTRSPFDQAIVASQASTDDQSYERTGELPFDFERRRLSVAVTGPAGSLLVTKGALESIGLICNRMRLPNGEMPLDGARAEELNQVISDLNDQGFRLLGLATKQLPAEAGLDLADEREMTFEGILAFSDPPKPGVEAVMNALSDDGIRLVVLTGDAAAVSRHVCREIGMKADSVIEGTVLDGLSDERLADALQSTNVFARVSPEQKLRIIKQLQSQGHVVGYIGDGINDAPSLRAADVGISVAGAVDIAREAAQIVLLEKNLLILHEGVVEGRKVFANVMKYIMMGTSSNFGNMLSMAGAVLFLPFLPLLPSQVLINNALYDFAQVSIPSDHVDPAMVRRPRGWDMRFIRDFMLIFGPISSAYDFLTFFALRRLFGADEVLFHTGWFIESLATQTLVIFVIRTLGPPLKSKPSVWLSLTVCLVVFCGTLLPFTPIGDVLGFVAPPVGFMAFLVGAVTSYLVIVEIAKRAFYRWHPLG